MNANNPLTEHEENLIKDILKELACSQESCRKVSAQIRLRAGLGKPLYNRMCDSIFLKLGNGRVTFTES